MKRTPLLSIVVPFLNEESNLRALAVEVLKVFDGLSCDGELILVDDGSQDRSVEVVHELAARDARVKLVSLSRNFGTQMAICAGLEFSRGDAVVVMDADLQHPPELIPDMLRQWQAGYEVVYTIRDQTESTGLFRRLYSELFSRVFNRLADTRIDPQGSDFRLMDRKVVNQLVAMRERRRFFRCLATWVGFRQIGIPFKTRARLGGQSKYNLRRLLSLAADAIMSFSTVPLRLCAAFGCIVAVSVVPYALWAVYQRLFTNEYVPGWPATIVSILFLGAVQLISLGVLGEYVGRIYDEVKRRPLFIVRETSGFEPVIAEAAPAPRMARDEAGRSDDAQSARDGSLERKACIP